MDTTQTTPQVNEDGMLTLPADFYDQDDSDNACYLCGKPRYTPLYRVTHFGFPFLFQKCQCGMIKQTPMPNERFFEWFFNAEEFFEASKTSTGNIWGYQDYFSDEPSRLATSRLRFQRLQKYFAVDRPLEIMKIGPGTGTFLYVAKQHGHHAMGCDVSARFRQFAQTTYGVQVDHGRFERMDYREGQFDVVVLLNVIENVPNQVEFLSAIQRTIKPGGYFIFNFVDMHNNLVATLQKARYFLYRPPVCYAYDMDVIQKIMDKFQFQVRDTILDFRYMTLEKMFTLLGWKWAWDIARSTHVHRKPFPIYAYPSKIVIAQKV